MAQSAAYKHDSTRRATYQDVLDAPAHVVAEIIDGTLHTHPRPAPTHTVASSVLGGELGPPFHRGHGGPGGWWILDEPELHLGEDVLVPDLAGWRRERMPELPDTAYFSLGPRRPERAYMDILKNATRTILRRHTSRWMTTFRSANMNLANLVTRCPS